MNKKVFVLLLLAFCIKLNAQEYYFDISKYTCKVPYSTFTIDSIIDARDDKNCIGYVCKGINNKPTAAYLNHGLKYNIESYLSDYFKSRANSEHLIIRFNRLLVYELIYSNSQIATVEINLSFIVKNGNKFLEKFQAGVAIQSKSINDVTNFQDENITKAIDACILQYIERDKYNVLVKFTNMKETDLYANPLNNLNYPVSTINTYDRGIYRTFYDFRDYTPDKITQFSIEYTGEKNNSRTASIKGANNKTIKDIWGFSDGVQNYVRLGNEYYSIQKRGDLFSIYNYPPDFETNIGYIGMLGGLFFSSIYIASAKKIEYNIDFPTGRFVPYTNSEKFRIESKIIVLSSKYNKLGKDIELYINEEKYSTLSKGTYSALSFNSDVKEVNIDLMLNGEKTSIKIQPVLFNTGLCLVLIKGDKIVVENPNTNLRREIITDIENGKYKKTE